MADSKIAGPGAAAAVLPRAVLPRLVLVVFVAVALTNLTAVALEVGWLEAVSKAMLMPSLALWVITRRGPWLIVLALLFSTVGDVLLGYEGLFIAGMGAFAAAHVCYVVFFVGRGALPNLRRRWPVVAAYVVVWTGLIIVLWPGLGDLQLPVAAYSLLLTATGMTSAGHGLRAGLGGALFFASDAMIAMGIADVPRPLMPGLWIMSTYIVAQYLLASGSIGLNGSKRA